jgi:hypothetical protein
MVDCPRCLRIRIRRHGRTVGLCQDCRRWQHLDQSGFTAVDGEQRHLGCIACGAAWCSDVELRVDGDACADAGHVHAAGACPGVA